jgi:hypothetical protein
MAHRGSHHHQLEIHREVIGEGFDTTICSSGLYRFGRGGMAGNALRSLARSRAIPRREIARFLMGNARRAAIRPHYNR